MAKSIQNVKDKIMFHRDRIINSICTYIAVKIHLYDSQKKHLRTIIQYEVVHPWIEPTSHVMGSSE